MNHVLDNLLRAINIQQSSNYNRQSTRVHFLHIDLNVLLVVIAVQVQHQVVNKVESVAHNDQRQLIIEFRFFKERLYFFSVVAVALTADSLDLFDLASFACSLDVLEMYICILTKVDYGSEEIEQT